MTDKELLKIAKGFTRGLTKGDINQKCFVISWPLASYLRVMGVDCELIQGEVDEPNTDWGHYWIKLKDGRILDPTAGQFKELKMSKIYLGVLPKEYRELC